MRPLVFVVACCLAAGGFSFALGRCSVEPEQHVIKHDPDDADVKWLCEDVVYWCRENAKRRQRAEEASVCDDVMSVCWDNDPSTGASFCQKEAG